MSLNEQLANDVRSAMREGDVRRRDVLRFLRSAIANAEIEKRAPLTDDEIQNVIRTQVKQRRDSIEMFQAGRRTDLVDEEEAQIAILLDYLPAQMSHEEVVALVRSKADELDATSPRDMGRLMPALIEAAAGRVEGRALSQAAKDELSRRSAG